MSTRSEIRYAGSGPKILRADSKVLRVGGIASSVESPYDMGGYDEVMARGAFTATLAKPGLKVVLTRNHDFAYPYAITTNGSLRLSETSRGLKYDATLDGDDPAARALARQIEDGRITESSFAFRVVRQQWNDDRTLRRILEVDLDRGDVAACTYGANPLTPTVAGDLVSALSAGRPAGAPARPTPGRARLGMSSDLARARAWALIHQRNPHAPVNATGNDKENEQ